MATPKKKVGYDLAKFEKMSSPIRIRVDRQDRRSGKSEPIPLPQDVWSKEDAARIEEIILNDISGGGAYKAQMTDSRGDTIEWEFYYPPDFFPSKIPPMLAGAIGPAPMPPSSIPSGIGSSYQPGYYGTPIPTPAPAHVPSYQQPQPQQQVGWQPGAQWHPQYGWVGPSTGFFGGFGGGFGGYDTSALHSTSRRGDDKTEALQRELEQFKAAAMNAEHRREREAAEARHREELRQQQATQAEQLRQIREEMKAAAKPRSEEDPALQAMKAQVEEMRRNNERLQAERDRDAAETRHRDEMRMLKESNDRSIDELKRLVEKSSENSNPQMMMLMELQRQQAEVQRESNRVSAEQARETTRMAAEQPRVVMEMMRQLRESMPSTDKIVGEIGGAYKGVIELNRAVMETALSMQGSPGWEMAGQAMDGAKKAIDQFLNLRRTEVIAKAQTEAARAQAQAQAQAAQQAQVFYGPQGVPTPGQIAGGAADADDEEDEDEEIQVTAAQSPAEREQAIFGPVYDHVLQLRKAVAEEDVKPEDVANYIVAAVVEMDKHEIIVPAFTLLTDRRYADLIDVLLPGVTSEFAGECVKCLQSQIDILISEDGAHVEQKPRPASDGAADNKPPAPTPPVIDIQPVPAS